MKKRISFLCALLFCATLFAAPKGIQENPGHGPDEELFLDPYLYTELTDVSDQVVLDAGCSAGLWSIVAAQNGATVCGIDSEPTTLEKAQIAIAQAGVEREIELSLGDVASLPYEAGKFHRALSVNLGCNLPSHSYESGLYAHFREVERVLEEGGHLLVAAPASLGVVFADGKHSREAVMEHIQQVLSKIGHKLDAETIVRHLNELKEVNRATFVRRGNHLVLVTNEKELRRGEPIWRKVPHAVVPNYYHSEEEYLVAIHSAGLFCEEIKRPCFFGNVKYKAYRAKNDELGEAYIENHPFTIYYVSKQL